MPVLTGPVVATPGQPRTGPQLITVLSEMFSEGMSTLMPPYPVGVTYNTYRDIRKDPTVSIGRAALVAPLVSAEWSVDADPEVPEEIVAFVRGQIIPLREMFIERTARGLIDFGWQPFEVVWELTPEGRMGISKLKPLLHDITQILVETRTGKYAGIEQNAFNSSEQVVLTLGDSLVINREVEGTNWYGVPLLENVRETWKRWRDADEGAARYDTRIAGSHWLVKYPEGQSVTELGAEPRNNDVVARELLAELQASGSLTLPVVLHPITGEPQPGWDVQLISDSGPKQPSFVDRQRYLDTLKIRAMLTPERAVLEGQFGTRAEAGVHADIAVTLRENEHRDIVRQFNWHVVDKLVARNFGVSWVGKLRASASPLVDASVDWYRTLYAQLLGNPTAFVEIFASLDWPAMMEKLGLPKRAVSSAVGLGALDQNDPLAKAMEKLYEAVNGNPAIAEPEPEQSPATLPGVQ